MTTQANLSIPVETPPSATLEHPWRPQRRQAALDVGVGIAVSVGTARVVEAERRLAARQGDLAHGDAEIAARARHVDFSRVRHRVASLRWYYPGQVHAVGDSGRPLSPVIPSSRG